jgi:hypothetical protein
LRAHAYVEEALSWLPGEQRFEEDARPSRSTLDDLGTVARCSKTAAVYCSRMTTPICATTPGGC